MKIMKLTLFTMKLKKTYKKRCFDIKSMIRLKCKEMNDMKTKEFIGLILAGVLMVGILFIAMNRFEKIESGEMTLVNQNQMDR